MTASHRLVIKDAIWQILWRVISALCGFLVIKIISPYLWPLRYGDYSTILKYFAIWSALADFGLYVIAVKRLGQVKNVADETGDNTQLKSQYGKFVGTRFLIMTVVYTLALIIAYFLPAYTSNPYLIRGLPIGMIFSASFMAAGILQLPLQLFWKMEKLSFALIFARIVQILVLVWSVYVVFQNIEFNGTNISIVAFCMIIFSVLVSGLTQMIYVWVKSNKLLPLKISFDLKFTKNIIKENWKYWAAYYLSSFHTLIVLIFLSNFFPTSEWHTHTGIWALGLALIEIFLIIPSALGNSLLHKVASFSNEHKKKSFGNLMTMIFWIGWIIFVNFLLFNEEIVQIISWSNYISDTFANPGTNLILPFLAVVLWMSFVKQIFNYIFVANEKQNVLLKINLIWVILWVGLWLYTVPKYGINGWIVTQLFLEIMFVSGAILVAWQNKLLPIINYRKAGYLTLLILIFGLLWRWGVNTSTDNLVMFFVIAGVFNILFILPALPTIKKIARWLTIID